jgi:hypothetical protein
MKGGQEICGGEARGYWIPDMHVGGSSKKLMKLCCGCPAQDDWRHIFLDQTYLERAERDSTADERARDRERRESARARAKEAGKGGFST